MIARSRTTRRLVVPCACALLFFIITSVYHQTIGIALPLLPSSRQTLLTFGHEGLATVAPSKGKTLSRHPIHELIQRGIEMHAEQAVSMDQTRSLEAAVRDYENAFGMAPPQGFEVWHDLTLSLNATTAPSLLPQAHLSVLPYLAMPPRLLRKRVTDARRQSAVFGVQIDPSLSAEKRVRSLDVDDESKSRFPSWEWVAMIKEDAHLFPPSQDPLEPVQVSIWVDDGGFRLANGKLLEEARVLARAGKSWSEAELLKREDALAGQHGWLNTCNEIGSGGHYVSPNGPQTAPPKSFVAHSTAAADYCIHPELTGLNGELIMKEEMLFRPLQPVMAISKPLHGADILGPPTSHTQESAKYVRWADKVHKKAVWRGTASGIYHLSRWDWRSSQRDRLSFFAHSTPDEEVSVLVERENGTHMEVCRAGNLAKQYLDVGVIDHNVAWMCGQNWAAGNYACNPDLGPDRFANCPGEGNACEEMKKEHTWVTSMPHHDQAAYKYQLDIDGFGWSSRWRLSLQQGSVQIKPTIYDEWWSKQAIPWFHYVPSKYDYTDLYDILAFFAGSPDGSEQGRDDLGEIIGLQGREFALTRLRWEDMRSYMFLVLLEYRRAWSDDRRAASYKGSRFVHTGGLAQWLGIGS